MVHLQLNHDASPPLFSSGGQALFCCQPFRCALRCFCRWNGYRSCNYTALQLTIAHAHFPPWGVPTFPKTAACNIARCVAHATSTDDWCQRAGGTTALSRRTRRTSQVPTCAVSAHAWHAGTCDISLLKRIAHANNACLRTLTWRKFLDTPHCVGASTSPYDVLNP